MRARRWVWKSKSVPVWIPHWIALGLLPWLWLPWTTIGKFSQGITTPLQTGKYPAAACSLLGTENFLWKLQLLLLVPPRQELELSSQCKLARLVWCCSPLTMLIVGRKDDGSPWQIPTEDTSITENYTKKFSNCFSLLLLCYPMPCQSIDHSRVSFHQHLEPWASFVFLASFQFASGSSILYTMEKLFLPMKKRQPDALAFMSPAPQVWFLGCPNSWTFSLTFASCHRATYHRTNANNSINLQENRPEKNKSQNPKPFEGKGLCQEVLFYMEELICSWCLTWLETSRIQWQWQSITAATECDVQ